MLIIRSNQKKIRMFEPEHSPPSVTPQFKFRPSRHLPLLNSLESNSNNRIFPIILFWVVLIIRSTPIPLRNKQPCRSNKFKFPLISAWKIQSSEFDKVFWRRLKEICYLPNVIVVWDATIIEYFLFEGREFEF